MRTTFNKDDYRHLAYKKHTCQDCYWYNQCGDLTMESADDCEYFYCIYTQKEEEYQIHKLINRNKYKFYKEWNKYIKEHSDDSNKYSSLVYEVDLGGDEQEF